MDSTPLWLPVQPHVLKYLHKHVGTAYFLSENDPFGILLFQLLRRPVRDKRRDEVIKKYQKQFTVHYGLYDPKKFGLKEPTGKSVYQFNKFCRGLLFGELHAYVELMVDMGNAATYAIETFMLKYDLREEDVQFDTLARSWKRYLKTTKALRKRERAAHLSAGGQLKQLTKDLRALPLPGVPGYAIPAPPAY
ncbi:hypothetical protein [Hymenobacter terricola]|uniref:hypothetical protein n=1 Tax=Hymenobacter terricola TaxID=2819236 RepID=UPI001B3120B6|nr:hypothetical protein [Hymenobacter terricola]